MQCSFLSGATQAHFTILNRAISAGKIAGMTVPSSLQASGSSVLVGACAGIFGCGVSFVETSDTNVAAPVLGAGSAAYTLVWQVDEQLYSQPELVWVSGLQEPGFSNFAVVVGWLLYPGSSLTLSTSMLVAAPRAAEGRVLRHIMSDTVASMLSSKAGAKASVMKVDAWTTVKSTSSIVELYRLPFEVQADSSPVTCIAIDLGLSSQAYLRTWLKKDGETETLVSSGQINGALSKSTQLIPLVQMRMEPWQRFQIYVDLVLAPGSSAELGAISFTNETITSQRSRQ